MKYFLLLFLLLPLVLQADPGHDKCKGSKPCEIPGPPGPPGADGIDGIDGIDGVDGRDGIDGVDGVDGKDAVIPIEWYDTFNNANKWHRTAIDVAAAQQAMQVYLPQDQKSRMTFGMSRVGNTTGAGFGYAYMMNNDMNTALTVAVGVAGSETAVSVSAGFEFGGVRRIVIPVEKIIYMSPPDPEPEPVVVLASYDDDIELLQMEQVEQSAIQNDYDARLRQLESRKAAVETVLIEQSWMTDERRAKLEAVISQ